MKRSLLAKQTALAVSVLSLLLSAGPVAAQVPHLVRYQGHVVDSQQVPLEGEHTLKFKLYPSEAGGVPAWQETHSAVTLSEGDFSVLLGSVESLAGVDWNQPYWLSIQVDAEPELAPRQRITSVPLAIRAHQAEALTQQISPTLIAPQGTGSALDADTVDGQHAAELLDRTHHTGTQSASTISGTFAPSKISPQGPGSLLNADSLDGVDSADFARSNHGHECTARSAVTVPVQGGGYQWAPFAQACAVGEWCVLGFQYDTSGPAMLQCTTRPSISIMSSSATATALCCK